MIDWHRLLGIALTLHFAEYPLTVDLEKEIAIKRQILDILIIKKEDSPLPYRMPDGLEDLAHYNLLTYKSMQETLNDWALKELTGHYVNYRKVISPSLTELLPEDQFHLFAISTRYPQKLARQSGQNWQKLQEGVYQLTRGSDKIRIIVLKEIPKAEYNVVWQLFSAQQEKVQDAARRYIHAGSEINTMINGLLRKYQAEEIHMSYTLEDFRKEIREDSLTGLDLLTAEERLRGLTPEERLAGLDLEERLAGLDPEDVLAGLSAKDRKWLAELLLKGQGDESADTN